MLYSVSYRSTRKQEADELRCPLNQTGQIQKYLEQGKRCLVTDIESLPIEKAFEELNKLKDICDYTVACGDLQTLHTLLEGDYNAFLRYPVSDWESFNNLIKSAVTDIYVDGPIAFQASALLASKQDKKLRTSPQVSPNSIFLPDTIKEANTFFIRPEDMHLYEGVFDIVDFREKNQEKEDILFDIYKRGHWQGDLKDLIETLDSSVSNPYIKPEFGESRLNCGQRCKVPGRSCHLCQTQITLTNTVVDYFTSQNEVL